MMIEEDGQMRLAKGDRRWLAFPFPGVSSWRADFVYFPNRQGPRQRTRFYLAPIFLRGRDFC